MKTRKAVASVSHALATCASKFTTVVYTYLDAQGDIDENFSASKSSISKTRHILDTFVCVLTISVLDLTIKIILLQNSCSKI